MKSADYQKKQDIKLVSFDFDGTLVEENSWALFNEACGLEPDIDKEYYRQYHAGEITYDAWLQALVDIWKSKTAVTPDLGVVAAQRLTLRPGVVEVFAYLREKGYKIVVTTGGVDMVVCPFLERLGIVDIVFATESVFDNGVFIGIVNNASKEESREAGIFKRVVFQKYLEKQGIAFDQCAHVGDGSNDMNIFSVVAEPFYFDTGVSAGEVPFTRITDMLQLKEYL